MTVIFLKKKKTSVLKFEPGSKLPVIFYGVTAVILSCAFMIITLITSGFSFTLGKSLESGDLNYDKAVNASDALQIMMREAKKSDFNGAQIDAADLNGDGVINELDALLIVQYSSESSDKLGVLAKGNSSLEAFPTAVPANIDSTDESDAQSTDEKEEEEYVHNGNSIYNAFCTNEEEIYTSAKIVNKWYTGGKHYYQVEITLRNNSDSYMTDGTVELEFSKNAAVEKTWCCTAQTTDFGIDVTTQNNAYIASGSQMDCGLIVSSDFPLEIEKVSK